MISLFTHRAGLLRRLLLLLLLAPAMGCGGGSAAPSLRPADGSFAVGTTNFTFVDTSRPTAENKGAPAKDSRTLRTAVFYPIEGPIGNPARSGAPPIAGRRFPLIVFAHGLTAIARIYTVILQAWAEAGYVVAAPDFPLSSGTAPGGANKDDVVNQPADESFVIDQMLLLDGDPASLLHGAIDRDRIGASGQSLGGMTTFGVAFNTCCRDPRIDAAVPLAGSLILFPAGEYDPDIGPPVLIVHGDADESVPYESATEAYALLLAPKFLLTHLGGRHVPPYVGSRDAPPVAATIDASIAFFDLFLKHERDALERLIAVGQRAAVTLQYDL